MSGEHRAPRVGEKTAGATAFVVDERPEPAYRALLRSGELADRARRALAGLAACRACPRECGTDRLHAVVAGGGVEPAGRGPEADKRVVASHIAPGTACFTGRYARVSTAFPHFGEEDCLRGVRGSGTIFFSFCNLRCVFCQNWDISQVGAGREVTGADLARLMLALERRGGHNINLVTPEHVVPQVLEAVLIAAEAGLSLPLVYNTSAYDAAESLALLDGVVDVYMPDLKTLAVDRARRWLKAADYPEVARRVIREMHRQVGPLTVDRDGLAVRGVLVRHLVMPDAEADAAEVFRFLADEVSPDTYVNVMGQYYPAGSVTPERRPELARRPHPAELAAALQAARAAGLHRLDARA